MKKSLFLIMLLMLNPLFAQNTEDLQIKEYFVIRFPDSYKSNAFIMDPVESVIFSGEKNISCKDSIRFGNDFVKWKRVVPDSSGWISDNALSNGYASAVIFSDKRRVVVIKNMGSTMFWINKIPRTGSKYCVKDAYQSWEPRFDFVEIPVVLEKGENRLFFRCTRGKLKIRIFEPESPVYLNIKDVTLPDLITGEKTETWGAVTVVNTTENVLKGWSLKITGKNLKNTVYPLSIIQPLSVKKEAFPINGGIFKKIGTEIITISLVHNSKILSSKNLNLKVKTGFQNHKRTFISSIDRSVQYYAVNPAMKSDYPCLPALIFSVHGASVEAVNQAGAYSQKKWAMVVAPTNRRPFGFDWEDWGALDALEVLEDAGRHYNYDKSRVYLTGHSMGGHGTIYLGVNFPDLWAAIGPSAGWASFSTYVPRLQNMPDTPVYSVLKRAANAGETLKLLRNLDGTGVYIIHGDKDNSVPVTESRNLAEKLKKFHKDWIYYEEPGASHWWDKSDYPGADCVDWQPMFDFFANHAVKRKEEIRHIKFSVFDPGVSSKYLWAGITAQEKPLKISKVDFTAYPLFGKITGTTENVSGLELDLCSLVKTDTVNIIIDNDSLCFTDLKQTVMLSKVNGKWSEVPNQDPDLKNPERYGPFKRAFNHNFVLIFGTGGNSKENLWAFSKARFDAECFWYQGNGSVDVCADTSFSLSENPDRSIILYGNRETNKLWDALLAGSPVQVNNSSLTVGSKKITGHNLGCVFIFPGPGSKTASIGVVAGTGITGMNALTTMPYLYAGYYFPDFLLVSDTEVKGAGFFGNDWKVEAGEFRWKE